MIWQLFAFVFVSVFVTVCVPVFVFEFVPLFAFEFVQELDWYCGLVVCNYATGGNLPSGDMYQVWSTRYNICTRHGIPGMI